jgi:hypothetical protein
MPSQTRTADHATKKAAPTSLLPLLVMARFYAASESLKPRASRFALRGTYGLPRLFTVRRLSGFRFRRLTHAVALEHVPIFSLKRENLQRLAACPDRVAL